MKPTVYGGYVEVIVSPILIMILGKEYDTASYLEELCAALHSGKSGPEYEKDWQHRLGHVSVTASRLIERARREMKPNSFRTTDTTFFPTQAGPCFSWALGVEMSKDGPVLRSRIETFGIQLNGRTVMHIDHAEYSGPQSIDAHVRRMRDMSHELVRLNRN